MDQRQGDLIRMCRELAGALEGALQVLAPETRTGFALLLFDLTPEGEEAAESQTYLAYISNAERKDMIGVLRQQLERMEAGIVGTQGQA